LEYNSVFSVKDIIEAAEVQVRDDSEVVDHNDREK
jgi:hypothetical protein